MMAEQKAIEHKIETALSGDALKNALDFAAFLRANEISPEMHDSGDGWSVVYGGESIGFILVNGAVQEPGPWTIWLNSCDFGGGPADHDLKETAWAHASKCGRCHAGWKDCGGGDRTILGREFENLCHSPLMFMNPDAKTLGNVKKLMLMLKQNIADGSAANERFQQ